MHSVTLATCFSSSILAQVCTQMHVYTVRQKDQEFVASLSYMRGWRQKNK